MSALKKRLKKKKTGGKTNKNGIHTKKNTPKKHEKRKKKPQKKKLPKQNVQKRRVKSFAHNRKVPVQKSQSHQRQGKKSRKKSTKVIH